MKKYCSFLLFAATSLILALFCGCATGDTLSPSDLTLEQLEAKMHQSMDPDGAYAASKSCFIRQEVRTPMFLDEQTTRLVETKMLRPDKFQILTSEENEPVHMISSDGVHGWIADYGSRRIDMLEGQDLRQTLAMTKFSNPAGTYSDFFPEIVVNKCRNRDGNFYLLTCRGQVGGLFKIYVESSTFLIRRITADLVVGDGIVGYESRIISYSRLSGVMVPRETETIVNGQKQLVRVITYQLNAPVKPEDFTPPVF